MKRRWGLAFFCLLAMAALSGHAEILLSGRTVPGEAVSMRAPYGGIVKRIDLRQGSTIAVGDEVVEMATTRVMATEDGVVTGIFAEPGDTAEQTVLYLAPVSKFTVTSSIKKAYESVDTTYVMVGETVYIKCAKDGTHRAIGRITNVSGSDYTVETVAGELYMEETVYLYRSPDYASETCIGSGKVSRTGVRSVQGTGSIIRMYVSDGEEVERGQTLFETVEGDIDGLRAMEPVLRSELSGIVAEVAVSAGQKVAKGDTLFTCYPDNSLKIEFDIPQENLSEVKVGDPVRIYFEWIEEKEPVPGVVTEIAFVANETETDEPVYSGYAVFENTPQVRSGMNVHVEIDQGGEE